MSIRMQAITIDAADPAALSRWWASVLGWRRVDIGQGERSWVVLADPEGDVRKAPTIEPFVRA